MKKLFALLLFSFIGLSTSAQTCNAYFNYQQNIDSCEIVAFTDSSFALDNIISWQWVFDDGDSSSLENPTHIYQDNGTYQVCLTITDTTGCSQTACQWIGVSCLPFCNALADYTTDSADCFKIDFKDRTSTNDSIVSWSWDFGNGYTSSLANPSWTFAGPGVYPYCLDINTASGCTSSYCDTIEIICNGVCDADFSYTIDPVYCDQVSFTDQSTSSDSIVSWLWETRDGQTSTAQNPTLTVGYHPAGNYVKLTIINIHGCVSEVYKLLSNCSLDACIAAVKWKDNCDQFEFFGEPRGPKPFSTYYWEFKTGQTSTDPNTSFTPTINGRTFVWFNSVAVDGCQTERLKVNFNIDCPSLPDSIARFTTVIEGCDTVHYTATDSLANATYSWTFGDGFSDTGRSVTHVYQTDASYLATLTVQHNGQTQSSSRPIEIDCIPDNNYSFSWSSVNGPDCTERNFYETSTVYDGDTSVSWYWDFGDGSSSNQQFPSHSFTNEFNIVHLTVQTANGNTVTIQKQVSIECLSEPCDVDFGVNHITCDSIQFTAYPYLDSSDVVTSYLWNFADGTTSTLANPTHKFNIMGRYYVTLNIETQDSCSASEAKMIEIDCQDSCQTFYKYEQTGCRTYQFYDQTDSVISDSNVVVTSFLWDFGLGQTSTVQNPVYQFLTSGQFYANLQVTLSNGCVANYCESILVDCPPCKANFSYGHDSSGYHFTDQSFSDTTILSWDWNFGDGSTSTQQNPSHQYAYQGSFIVSLDIVSASGCTSQHLDTIDVNSPFVPDTVCEADFRFVQTASNQIQFYNQSTFAGQYAQYNWDFGDGGSSGLEHPTHTYASNGTYLVTLTVYSQNGCSSSFSDSVTFSNIHGTCAADFVVVPDSCAMYQFVDQSTFQTGDSIVSWQWSFGDGSSSGLKNPTHTYTANGTYNIYLTIQTKDGCVQTHMDNVVVNCAHLNTCSANFGASMNNCVVSFSDSSSTSVGQIISYAWSFGDGSTSAQANPSHAYNSSGTYQVCLTISTSDNCTTTDCQSIFVNCPPPPSCGSGFSITQNSCSTYSFVDTSYASPGNIQSYAWDFGDGNSASSANPNHAYTANGNYTVSLTIVSTDSCVSTSQQNVSISCFPPPTCNSDFNYSLIGCPTVDFVQNATSSAGGVISYTWDFGDGGTSAQANPQHTYTANGSYIACLTIMGADSCVSTYCDTISITCHSVPTCQAGFQYTLANCPSVTFFSSSSANPGSISSYNWDFGDGTGSVSQNPTHTYSSNGNYLVSLTINTTDGCTSTYTDSVQVSCILAPSCNAAISSVSSCEDFTFTSTSSSSPGQIVSYHWDFGDGNTSNVANPMHSYAANGTYSVSLTIVTSDSCTSTYTRQYSITCIVTPVCNAGFQFVNNCPAVSFFDNSSSSTGNISTYAWDFGDGGSASSANPTHNYTSNGTYLACLTITTDDSCTSTYCDTVVITCFAPPSCNADFSYIDNCPVIAFSDSSTSSGGIASYSWDFGDGGSSNGSSPIHSYQTNGTFYPCLTIVTNDGCTSVKCDTVNIWCIPDPCTAAFSVDSSNSPTFQFNDLSTADTTIVAWSWTTSDGQSSSLQHPSFTFSGAGQYVICLAITSASGCMDTICESVYIAPASCNAAATANINLGSCEVTFVDQSSATDSIVSWHWNFGDGTTSSLQNPTHTYQSPFAGQWCLTITTINACVSTVCDSIWMNCLSIAEIGIKSIVYPNPSAGLVTLELENLQGDVKLSLVNVIGQQDELGTFRSNKVNLDLSTYPPGLYQLVIQSEDQLMQHSIILE